MVLKVMECALADTIVRKYDQGELIHSNTIHPLYGTKSHLPTVAHGLTIMSFPEVMIVILIIYSSFHINANETKLNSKVL